MALLRLILLVAFLGLFQVKAESQLLCHKVHLKAIDPIAFLKAKNLDPSKIEIQIDPIDAQSFGYLGQVRIRYNGTEVFWGKIFGTTAQQGIGRIVINTWNESFPLPKFKGLGLASLAYFTVAEYFYRTKDLILTSDEFYKGSYNDTLTISAQKQWDGFRSRGYLKVNTPEGRYGEFDPSIIQGALFEKIRMFAIVHLKITPHDPSGALRK